ncbi:MAG TPA: hypothetical protein VGK74_02560 [Symbiobacteriaceae bacterium]|jgi:hypothetical protein
MWVKITSNLVDFNMLPVPKGAVMFVTEDHGFNLLQHKEAVVATIAEVTAVLDAAEAIAQEALQAQMRYQGV